MMKSFFLKLTKYALVIALLSAPSFAYFTYMSPTKIALVNYQDFQAARILKANDSDWITISRVNKINTDEFASYDVIYIFGRGLSLTPEQVSAFQSAGDQGTQIVVEAATNPRIDVTNVAFKKLEKINDYLRFGGGYNYQQLLRFSRIELDGKAFGVEQAKKSKENTNDILFHKDENQAFTSVLSYEKYYKTLNSYKASGKKIALLTSVPGPFNANRDHLDAFIDKLEETGLRVYPIASHTKRLALIKEIDPDAVVMMPHGRMQLGSGQQTIAYLSEKNIPLFAPVSVFEQYEKWLENPQGYSANLLTMNIVLPELDGAVVPYAINAQFLDDNQYQIFKAIPDRLANFSDIISKWLTLKVKNNIDKKIAIVYFRGPGKNALVAGNMEVTPSLYNTLNNLKKQGYDLGDFPSDYQKFKADVERQGAVMAPYAQGLVEAFYQNANPALIPAQQYKKWCYQTLAKGLCQKIDNMYGKAPGNFMVTEHNGSPHLAVARVQYGNIVLLPQPLPGLGEDTFKLIHGTQKAPPHSYMSPYMWISEVFQADAIMHYGTHGSLEFTQGKQVALSQFDWADALIGNTPHFYVYTMSNVGEAIIAKRRSYATILSHLTSPFKESGLYSDLKTLSDLAAEFNQVQGSVQQNKKEQINKLIISVNLLEDLVLTQQDLLLPTAQWKSTVFSPLSQWLETIAQAKITSGLYTLGKAYTSEQAEQTARLMALDAVTQSYERLVDITGGQTQDYRSLAKDWINRIFQGESSNIILEEALATSLVQRSQLWFEHNKPVDHSEIIKGFLALGAKSQKQKTVILSNEALQQLTAQVISDGETKNFITGLSNEKSFAHVAQALDPEKAKKAKMLANIIPAIGKALAHLEDPNTRKLISAMQEPEVKAQVFSWIDSGDLAEQVAQKKKQQLEKLASSLTPQITKVIDNQEENNWLVLTDRLNTITHFKQKLKDEPELINLLATDIKSKTGLAQQDFIEKLHVNYTYMGQVLAQVKVKEQQLAQAVKLFSDALANLIHYKSHLLKGADVELASMINAITGGYVKPSSGGDPIINPAALPTGRNMFSIDAEKTPSKAAWEVGETLAKALLKTHLEQHGKYPEKVSFTLWPSEFIHTQGATVAEILYLLGVEPVRDPFGRVKNLKLIPAEELKRPRIDVVVQSAGQLRDLAASRLALIEDAVRMVADAEQDSQVNYVAKGVKDAEQYMLEKGISPLEARQNAYRRSFGGVNGAYGTGIMSQVESSDSWQDNQEIAKQYLNNMGAVYGDSESWGESNPHLFAAVLQNTDVVIQPRSSNTWGALSLDHVYEFMGGLNLAVREVTGKDPDAYFNDYRNPNSAQLSTLNETVWTELRSTMLNPRFINDLMQGEASSAETFAETFRNTFGWNVMKPSAIDDAVWNNLHDVYIKDRHNLNVKNFFEQQNPYALQEMTGVMLETARKGLWQATQEQLQDIATLHAELVSKFEAGCGQFTCGNFSLQNFIKANVKDVALNKKYQQQLDTAQVSQSMKSSVVLTKQGVKADNDLAKSESAKSEQPEQQTHENQKKQSQPQQKVEAAFNWLWLLLLAPLAVIIISRVRHDRN
jgi:cobaltochelatase CobN